MHAGGVADNTPWNDEKDPFEVNYLNTKKGSL